jgi:hypothetical protein
LRSTKLAQGFAGQLVDRQHLDPLQTTIDHHAQALSEFGIGAPNCRSSAKNGCVAAPHSGAIRDRDEL